MGNVRVTRADMRVEGRFLGTNRLDAELLSARSDLPKTPDSSLGGFEDGGKA